MIGNNIQKDNQMFYIGEIFKCMKTNEFFVFVRDFPEVVKTVVENAQGAIVICIFLHNIDQQERKIEKYQTKK
jgi:hypothetical protein